MPPGVLCTCIVGGAAERASRLAPSGRPRSSERETRAVRISHKADYGVRAVVALARALGDEPGTPVTRERLSTAESIPGKFLRSEEHTSELQSLMRNSSALFCLK